MFSKSDLQSAEQFRRALQLFAGTLSETQALEVPTVYPQYQTGHAYSTGDYLTCGTDTNGDPLLYKVVQDHTSQEDWPPADTPALYTCISLTEGGYPIWSPPSGAQEAYNAGVFVSYKGALYKSLIDGNTWAPDAYPDGWELYEEV